MYKVITSHELLPGKLNDFIAWFKRADEARAKENPAYKPFKRYVSVFGSGHRVIVEWEMEKLPEQPWAYAEQALTESLIEAYSMIVPGRTEVLVYKQLS